MQVRQSVTLMDSTATMPVEEGEMNRIKTLDDKKCMFTWSLIGI